MLKQAKRSIKISFLNIDLRIPLQRLPIIWLNFKNYYKKHGVYVEEVIWNEPILNLEGWTFDKIVDYYDKQDSDVYAFSSYLWSHMAIMDVARELKKRNANRIIVLGGPHLNITHNDVGWFIKNKFIDAICEPTSYGEWFITDMLNQLVEDSLNWKEVRFAISRVGRGPSPSKIDFEFPGGLIKGNEDILFKCKDIAMNRNIDLVLPMELTRGCPYECVFCEWGGGIGGKVIRKSMEYILEDLNWIPQAGIQQIALLDANYGIYKEDEEVSKYIEEMKKVFELPHHVEIYGFTKSKQERRWATVEPLARADLVKRYKLSLQSLSDKVLSNIKRTDIKRSEDFEFAKYLFDAYGIRSDFEMIMGLPGHTKNDFYDEVDIQYEHGYSLERYLWLLLPDSPAANPEYRKKFNIKTEKICMGKSKMNTYTLDDVTTFSEYYITDDPKYSSEIEFVVEADGYTRKDYTEFFFMNYWILENVSLINFTNNIIKHNVDSNKLEKPSLFFRRLYEKVNEPSTNRYVLAMKQLNDEMHELVSGQRKEVIDYRLYNLPFTDVSMDFSYIFKVCVVVFQEEYTEFLISIAEDLGLEVTDDIIEQFKEQADTYRRTFSTKYDSFYKVRTFYENIIRESQEHTSPALAF
jgi:radical SAM superfamily enzyme YgiQ (UPF0313 family)